jgi:hypothetical protein
MRDTIDMAREVYGAHTEWTGAPLDRLEQLVALVRADERDRAMRENAYVLAEREACARVCEDEICSCCWDDEAKAAAEHLAEAIRNRGNT